MSTPFFTKEGLDTYISTIIKLKTLWFPKDVEGLNIVAIPEVANYKFWVLEK
ncbi:hypothetical protein GCM10010965_27130 [Caldalkalibacillus thermarum]|nr:hypothetical protein GCM10010965_27130 [Caldalkalibacillus thermarum]